VLGVFLVVAGCGHSVTDTKPRFLVSVLVFFFMAT